MYRVYDAQSKIVASFYEDIWNKHDKSMIPQLLAPEFCFRSSLGNNLHGHEEFAGYVDFIHTALGEYHCEIIEVIHEENKSFARMLFSGIHQNEFFSYKASHKHVEWAGAALFTFKENKITDLWVLGDVYSLMKQLEENSKFKN